MPNSQYIVLPQRPNRQAMFADVIAQAVGVWEQRKAQEQQAKAQAEADYVKNLSGSVKSYQDFSALTPEQQEMLKARGFNFRDRPQDRFQETVAEDNLRTFGTLPQSARQQGTYQTAYGAAMPSATVDMTNASDVYRNTPREGFPGTMTLPHDGSSPEMANMPHDGSPAQFAPLGQYAPEMLQRQRIMDKLDPTGQEAWTNRNVTAPKTEAEIGKMGAETAAARALARERNASAGKTRAETSQIGASVTGSVALGEEALAQLPPAMRELVKKIANYEVDITKVASLRGKESERAKLAAIVSQYDPTWDMTQYNSRAAVRKDFTSGNASRNIRSLNTAVKHMEALERSMKALDNTRIPAANMVGNFVSRQSGNQEVDNFESALTAVTDELATLFKGTAGTDEQIKHWRRSMHANMSPEQQRGQMEMLLELLGGRLSALESQWESNMGKPKDFQILSPQSQKILERMGINLGSSPAPEQSGGQPKVGDAKQARNGMTLYWDGIGWTDTKPATGARAGASF